MMSGSPSHCGRRMRLADWPWATGMALTPFLEAARQEGDAKEGQSMGLRMRQLLK